MDDANEPSFPVDELPTHWVNVQCKRMITRLSIPEKRQLCCEIASGDVVAHFDSDDWSDPSRLQVQAELMQQSGKQVIGFHTMLFYDVVAKKVYRYRGWPAYALGSSLFYRREFWQTHPWQKTKNGLASDNVFVRQANDLGELHSIDAAGLMVARAHKDNSSPKQMYKDPFKEVSVEELPAGFPRSI